MATSIQIWLEIAHRAKYRLGGWAFVRGGRGGAVGMAGGARQSDLERTSLLALTGALAGLAQGAVVQLHTSSPEVRALPARIAAFEAATHAPSENLDAWAQASTGLRRVQLDMRPAGPAPDSRAAFAAAWAAFALDRTRDRGAFTAPIPKSNLIKAGV